MLKFEIVSPERVLASAEADAVALPAMEGDVTAMPGHAPMLTTLRPGIVEATGGSAPGRFVVTGGFAEIGEDAVSVLAEIALPEAEVDADWLAARIEAAEADAREAAAERQAEAAQYLLDLQALQTQTRATRG